MTEARHTQSLYKQAARYQSLNVDDEGVAIAKLLAPHLAQGFPFISGLAEVTVELLREEARALELPDNHFSDFTLEDHVNCRNALRRRIAFFKHRDRHLKLIREGLTALLAAISDNLPSAETHSPFTVPLINVLPQPRVCVQHIYDFFFWEGLRKREIFTATRDQLFKNLYDASGEDFDAKNPKLIHPIESTIPLEDLIYKYLRRTPFYNLLRSPFPIRLDHNTRFNHWHVLAGTGQGKTVLIENIILHDLKSEDRPSLIVIDSQGDLIRKISHLAILENIPHVLISPKDTKYPPALNIFDVNRERLGAYDEATREQVVAGVIQTFDYLFSGLVGADLSAKQGVFFKFVTRLMLSLPDTLGRNATILDMLRLIDDPTPYLPAIRSLPDIQREFFERDFSSKTFAQTKEQIRYRLHAIIENPTLARLFTSPSTKIDLFSELNNRSLILVDTAKDFLKGSSAHFGQIFISLVLQAVLERAAIPESKRIPAFLIVDEAAEYFDQNIDDLLTEARKFKLGCLFAHQYLDQASPALRASFAANTGIKFASGLSTHDARSLAADMRTTPDFILSQPKLQFAAYIRGVTPDAVSIPIEVGVLEREPQLTEESYRALLNRNRAKVSLPAGGASPPPAQEESYDW